VPNPIATIADMIRQAEEHADDSASERLRAIEYYRGEMKDTPTEEGRSKAVSRDVRSQIKRVLPSLMRTILGADTVVEYLPVGPNDEEAAQQASDYVNFVVMPKCDLRRVIEDALHDALLQRNGIIKWGWVNKRTVQITSYSGLPEEAVQTLIGEDGTELLSAEPQEVQTDLGPITLYDVTVRRSVVEGRLEVSSVPRERFLIHPDAVNIPDSPITGERTTLTRSDLVAMGYDRDVIDALQVGDREDDDRDALRDYEGDSDEPHKPNEQIDYYDVYVRFDADGDGIAELRHMCFAGGLNEQNLLRDEEAEEPQFADVKTMAQPHQWEGVSLADDLMDIQRIKTVLLRQTLDNLYWQNNLQPIFDESAVVDSEPLYKPSFGKPIRLRAGAVPQQAVYYAPVPFTAAQSYGMLEYLDREAEGRTGVSETAAGLSPDALQNMTATASSMIEQASIGQVELMARTAAEGLRRMFAGILRTIVKHQDVARTVRLSGKWVQFDPRSWNASMDCTVNTGLGAGTRERDLQTLQYVLTLQEKLFTAFGPQNPFVSPMNVWEAISKVVEAAGLKTPSLYFSEPDPEQVQQQIDAQAQKPTPEQEKLQAQMQLEQAKMQQDMQLEQARMQAARDKEAAQMQADMAVQAQRIEAEREKATAELAFRQKQHQDQMALEWAKLARDAANSARDAVAPEKPKAVA
jgi:Skp family chaperone for outer membrane proteins